MPDVFYSTNPSDYQQLEGLYISERKPAGFIRGADLNVIGLMGACVRGPITPQLITSPGQLVAMYGSRDQGGGGSVVGQVWASMLNKPFGSVVVRRVAAAAAAAALVHLDDVVPTHICKAVATSVGSWASGAFPVTVKVEAASDANAQHFNVRATYLGRDYVFANVDCSAGHDNTAQVSGSDPTLPIKLVKETDGRPLNGGPFTLAGGSDGALAASDYNAALDDLAAYAGIAVVAMPIETIPTVATFYAHLLTVAAGTFDRNFVAGANAMPSNTVANEITAEAAAITTQSDRIWWAFNNGNTIDPVTGQALNQPAHIWLASVLSQIDVDIHPGSFQTQAYLAGISSVDLPALSRGSLISLKNAGISTLEQLEDGFQFHSGVTTNLTSGLTEITRRRMADFLQLSAAKRLRTYVKGKNTPTVRAQMAGELTAFSEQLKGQERVVEDYQIDQVSVNSDTLRSQGEEHILWRVKLIGHMLELVFETEIATGTIIQRQ